VRNRLTLNLNTRVVGGGGISVYEEHRGLLSIVQSCTRQRRQVLQQERVRQWLGLTSVGSTGVAGGWR